MTWRPTSKWTALRAEYASRPHEVASCEAYELCLGALDIILHHCLGHLDVWYMDCPQLTIRHHLILEPTDLVAAQESAVSIVRERLARLSDAVAKYTE